MRLAVVVFVASCGRIDFDPLTSTATQRSAKMVVLGSSHACAIDADDHLWCWGVDSSGQLGDGGNAYVEAPVQVGTDTWARVSANGISQGQSFTCGIKSDNTLWCWGYNDVGEVGIGTSGSPVRSPTQVGTAQWQHVSAGINCNTCGIQQDGSLWCWGDDGYSSCGGYIGDGGSAPVLSPVEVSSGSWLSVSVGDADTCAVKADGTLWCWGLNGFDALGDGTTTPRPTPVQIGTSTSWANVVMQDQRGCGMQTDGSIWCWGANGAGQAGTGNTTDIPTPTEIGTDHVWVRLAVGSSETCAIDLGDYLWCWGDPTFGGFATDATLPVTLPMPVDSHGWLNVAAGNYATCGIHDGAVYCSGADGIGMLGDGGSQRTVPTLVDSGWTAITGGTTHFCALLPDSTMQCWGNGYQTPQPVAGTGWGPPISAGEQAQCATSAGALYCGGLIPGTATPTTSWVQEASFVSLSLGRMHACGLHADGTLWCFGDNSEHQLGVVSTGGPTPVQVPGAWLEVAAARLHTCAVASDHTLWCWGNNQDAQCGQPSTTTFITAPTQLGAGTSWAHVFSGSDADTTCAQLTTGELYCWGFDTFGELGDGGGPPSEVPHQILTATDWSHVSVAGFHACALRSGSVWCWGLNPDAGTGTTGNALPTAVTGPGFVDVAVSSGSTCALDSSGARWCWGYNTVGELGDNRAWSTSFVKVPLPP